MGSFEIFIPRLIGKQKPVAGGADLIWTGLGAFAKPAQRSNYECGSGPSGEIAYAVNLNSVIAGIDHIPVRKGDAVIYSFR